GTAAGVDPGGVRLVDTAVVTDEGAESGCETGGHGRGCSPGARRRTGAGRRHRRSAVEGPAEPLDDGGSAGACFGQGTITRVLDVTPGITGRTRQPVQDGRRLPPALPEHRDLRIGLLAQLLDAGAGIRLDPSLGLAQTLLHVGDRARQLAEPALDLAVGGFGFPRTQ